MKGRQKGKAEREGRKGRQKGKAASVKRPRPPPAPTADGPPCRALEGSRAPLRWIPGVAPASPFAAPYRAQQPSDDAGAAPPA
eukprot:gene13617-biopygen3110